MELRGAAATLFDCRDSEVLVEGRAGTGKSIGILSKLHHCARQYPGARILVCRQFRASATESVMATFENKVLGPTHPLVVNGPARANRHSHDYPNGSTVVWGGLDQAGKLFSTEWDLVYVNEATEIALEPWELFGRAMRNNAMPYQQQIADCNPGPPSHWLNQRATACGDDLRRVESMADYRRLQAYNEGPQAGPMRRLVSVHADNPAYFDLEAWAWLAKGLAYLKNLQRMSGHRRQRMLHGLWVAGEGTVYAEFALARHVITPFKVPADWPIVVGVDPGYDHPCAILWLAVAPNGCFYIIDELYRGGLSVAQHAAAIKSRNAGRTVHRYYADPQHAFSRTAQSPKTIASQFRECGLSFAPWPRSTDVEAMVEAVRTRLNEDRLKVFAPCSNTISEFQSWRYKRTAAGALPSGDDQYEDANNHALDVVKGLVAVNPGGGKAFVANSR